MGATDAKGLIGPEKINPGFIDEILVQMDEEGLEVQDTFDPSTMAAMLRSALNQLVQDVEPDDANEAQNDASQIQESKEGQVQFGNVGNSEKLGSGKAKSSKLKGGMTTMEDILEQQALSIEDEISSVMDEVLGKTRLDCFEPENELFGVDPEVLKMTRLTNELVNDLMWNLGRQGPSMI